MTKITQIMSLSTKLQCWLRRHDVFYDVFLYVLHNCETQSSSSKAEKLHLQLCVRSFVRNMSIYARPHPDRIQTASIITRITRFTRIARFTRLICVVVIAELSPVYYCLVELNFSAKWKIKDFWVSGNCRTGGVSQALKLFWIPACQSYWNCALQRLWLHKCISIPWRMYFSLSSSSKWQGDEINEISLSNDK